MTGKTHLFSYGLFKFYTNPKKSADLGYFQKLPILLKMTKNPSRKWVKDLVFGMWTGKIHLFSYGLFKFYANPKNQLILAIFKNCQFHLKWPKTLLENGFKTYFLVCDRENPFIWTFQILRQPPPNLNNLFLFKRIGCNICE